MKQSIVSLAWLLGFACLVPLGASVAEVEIAQNTIQEAPRPRQGIDPVHTTPVRLDCWQQGVQIIEREGLEALSLSAAAREDSVSLKRLDDENPTVFILSFAEGLCLVQPEDDD